MAQYDAQESKIDLALRDLAAKKVVVKDRRGATTTYEFEAAHRMIKVTAPEGDIMTFVYDLAGNRTAATLPNGTSIAWTYDNNDAAGERRMWSGITRELRSGSTC